MTLPRGGYKKQTANKNKELKHINDTFCGAVVRSICTESKNRLWQIRLRPFHYSHVRNSKFALKNTKLYRSSNVSVVLHFTNVERKLLFN